MIESRYVEKKQYLSRYSHERIVAVRESRTHPSPELGEGDLSNRAFKDEVAQLVGFLTKKCALDFRGRVLEIGAGSAWLSAELSKHPTVVEVITTDFSTKLLKEQAPKTFKLLKANTAKITRMPADFHQLDFPDNYFDLVVCSTVLHHASNIVQALREVKRVLKPGGKFVAVREPVWPLVKIKSRTKMLQRLVATGVDERFYTLSDYKEFFRQAALPLEVKRVNLSRGFKYYIDKLVNGLTHARYAFVGTKRNRPLPQTRPRHTKR
jgi:ubiquinone/menaquinone biosynthesis C-methylase UbiE